MQIIRCVAHACVSLYVCVYVFVCLDVCLCVYACVCVCLRLRLISVGVVTDVHASSLSTLCRFPPFSG